MKNKQVIVIIDTDSLREGMISNEELGKQVRRMVVSVNHGNDLPFMKFVGLCNTDKQTDKELLVINLQQSVRDTKDEIIQKRNDKPFNTGDMLGGGYAGTRTGPLV